MIEATPDSAMARVKAETLIESLDWLRQFHNKVIVIKFGGNAMVDQELQRAFAQDVAYLRYVGIKPVVVHGGGPQITARLSELGIESIFRGGMRVTDEQSIPVIKDVLKNQIGRQLAELIQEAGASAKVLSGEDENLFKAVKVQAQLPEGPVDLGLVGEVRSVNPRAVLNAIENSIVPVISSIAPNSDGHLLNVNADLAAAALAVAVGAEKLMVLTDVQGLYSDWPNKDSLISSISTGELKQMLPKLESGMIPKMQACLEAVEGGVPKAHIIDGRTPHSILLEVFTKSGVGTQVTR